MGKLVRILVSLLVLVAVLLALPFFTGMFVEKKSHETVGQILAFLKEHPDTEFKLVNYHRGWFSSKADFAFIMKDIEIDHKKIDKIEFDFRETIQHGPFIFTREPSGGFDFFIGQALIHTQLLSSTMPLAPLPIKLGRSLLNFGGSQISWVHVDTLALEMDGITITLSSLDDAVEIRANGNKINNTLKLGKATIEQGKNEVAVNGIHVHTDLIKNEQGIWLGEKNIKINSIAINSDDQDYRLETFYSNSKMFEKEGKISSYDNVLIRQIGRKDQLFGPQQLWLEIDGINAKALGKLNEIVLQMKKTENAVEPNRLFSLFIELLNKGFEANVKALKLTTPWGKLSFDSSLKVPEMPDNKHIDALLFHTDGVINADISKQLSQMLMSNFYQRMMDGQLLTEDQVEEQARQHLNKLVKNGWLIPEGDEYHIALSFQKGQFLVNHKALKLQDLMPKVDLDVNATEVKIQPEEKNGPAQPDKPEGRESLLPQENKADTPQKSTTPEASSVPQSHDSSPLPLAPVQLPNSPADLNKAPQIPKNQDANSHDKGAYKEPVTTPEENTLQKGKATLPPAHLTGPGPQLPQKAPSNALDHLLPTLPNKQPGLKHTPSPANDPQATQPNNVNE